MKCSPNRGARLTRLAEIKAQIGYKRRLGIDGGRPAVAIDNELDRKFDAREKGGCGYLLVPVASGHEPKRRGPAVNWQGDAARMKKGLR